MSRKISALLLLLTATAFAREEYTRTFDKTVSVQSGAPVRIEHKYEVFREGTVICEAATTLACVDRDGKLQAMPEWLVSER